MHELSVIQSILEISLKHARENNAEKVLGIGLKVGELSDLVNEWMQRYFDYLSKNTIAEGAILKIERLPVVFRCEDCKSDFTVPIQELERLICPHCGSDKAVLVSGREYYIDHLEVT